MKELLKKPEFKKKVRVWASSKKLPKKRVAVYVRDKIIEKYEINIPLSVLRDYCLRNRIPIPKYPVIGGKKLNEVNSFYYSNKIDTNEWEND